jgi:hypothetical protein
VANVEEDAGAAVGVDDLEPPFALGHEEAVVAGVGDGRDLVEPARQRRGAKGGLAGGQGTKARWGMSPAASPVAAARWATMVTSKTSNSAANATEWWSVGRLWRIGC